MMVQQKPAIAALLSAVLAFALPGRQSPARAGSFRPRFVSRPSVSLAVVAVSLLAVACFQYAFATGPLTTLTSIGPVG